LLTLAVFLSLFVLVLVVKGLFVYLRVRFLMRRDLVVLEITPPAFTPRSAAATKHLFMTLHGLQRARPRKQKLLRRPVSLSFEVVATKQAGVKYCLVIDRQWAATVRQAVQAYLPGAVITLQPQQISGPSKGTAISFHQSGHYAFPLGRQTNVDEHDPIAYVTGMMDALKDDESISYQLVVSPIRSRQARKLTAQVLRNDFETKQFSSQGLRLLTGVSHGLSSALFGITDMFRDAVYTSTKPVPSYNYQTYDRQRIAANVKPARQLSSFEEQLLQLVHDKITDPLFHVDVRVFIQTVTTAATTERVGAAIAALASYDMAHYQSLQPSPRKFLNQYRSYLFHHRLPALRQKSHNVLSAAELANLFHFPLSESSHTDNLITSLSRSLPAPVSLKQHSKPAIVVGQNVHRGISTPIGLTEAERERHVYIIGGTGNGKTTMLQYAIVQDMQHGKGVAVIDPHGDMAETLLRHVPADRVQDVIYFNPDDLDYPIGLNLLELTPGLSGNELLREKDLITESVVSVFRKIFSEEDSGGHRIEYVLRNTVQTALTIPDATLFTVFDLLNDPKFRKAVIKSLTDKNLINFWKNELGKAGDMQKVKMAAGITAKIGRFLFSASAKQILEQPRSTIDFDDIINSGKILICNFSKGLLGEDTSELFGITVLAKLQLASLRRARLSQAERQPFYLYVDEFQNFATPSFVQMLSESRKYKLFMTMAEQSTSQQKDQQMVSIILANVGTVICFRTGNPNDERLLLPLFKPYIEECEISNLAAYHFYAKLSALRAQEPLSGQTLLLAGTGNGQVATEAITASRHSFAKQQTQVTTTPDKKAAKPIAKKKYPKATKAKSTTMLDLA